MQQVDNYKVKDKFHHLEYPDVQDKQRLRSNSQTVTKACGRDYVQSFNNSMKAHIFHC